MNSNVSALFSAIIDCGLNQFGKSGPCASVIGSQGVNKLEDFHIPEPWNGDIAQSRILFISINPGYSPGELYPRKGNPFWLSGGVFNMSKVEGFFEGRFDVKNRYVEYKPGGHAFKISMENGEQKRVNGFWPYVFKMAETIIPGANPCADFAITELVHCKSKDASYVDPPCYSSCLQHLDKILSIANNVEYIVFIGASVRERVCAKYGFNSPQKQKWYITTKLNNRNTKIVFVDHNNAFPDKNGKRYVGVVPPPPSCPTI